MFSTFQPNLSKISNFLLSQKTVAVCLPKEPTHDNWCAGLAMIDALTNAGVETKLYSENDLPKGLHFLPYSPNLELKNTFENEGVVLTIPKQLGTSLEIHTESNEETSIYTFTNTSADVSIESIKIQSTFEKIDVFVVIGAKSLTELGVIFEAKPSLFYTRPIINIDASIQNELFGTENLITSKTNSLSHWIYQILTENKNFLISPQCATILFAGITIHTDSFQVGNTTPDFLNLAGKLLEHGANHQQVIQNIFKTKSCD
jgi:hypothetical protein